MYRDNEGSIIQGNCLDHLAIIPPDAFLISDPPYNVSYHYRDYGDNLPHYQYVDMLKQLFKGKKSVIIHYPEVIINIFGGGVLGDCEEVVSWVYNSNTAKQSRLVTWWNCSPDFTKVGQPYKNPTDKRIAERISQGKEARLYDWWEIDQVKNVSKEHEHPCPIPYELAKRIILTTTNEGDTVVDPFCGVGTVLRAAKALRRKYIGIELDKNYYDTAVEYLKEVII